jgi:hypothetical protein
MGREMPLLFHVDRKASLHEGQVLELVPWSAVLPADRIPDQDLQAHVEELFPAGLSWHGRQYLFWQNKPAFPMAPGFYVEPDVSTMRSHAIDLIFEYVRRSAFPERPSRYQSWFCWTSMADVDRFLALMNAPGAAVWEVDGEPTFRADANLLGLSTALRGSFVAHRYWRGEPLANKQPHWECFVGPGAVVGRRIR